MRRALPAVLALIVLAVLFAAWRALSPADDAALPATPTHVTPELESARARDLVATPLDTDSPSEVRRAPVATNEISPTPAAPGGPTIRGRVVASDGNGMPNVEITLRNVVWIDSADREKYDPSGKETFALVHSTKAGEFLFAVNPPTGSRIGRCIVSCRAPGFSTYVHPVTAAEGERETDVGDLVLRPGTTLSGFVRDRDHVVIENARVFALTQIGSGSWQTLGTPTRSLADGSFTLVDGPSGEIRMQAQLEDGRRSADIETRTLEPGSALGGFELVVPIYADDNAVSGIVLDVDGEPLPLARLSIARFTAESQTGWNVVADERGRFRLSGRPGASFHLTAEHPRGEAASAHMEDVSIGRHDIVLRLTPIRRASLHVSSSSGGALERFAYRLRLDSPIFVRFHIEVEASDHANGEVVLALPGEPFFVQVSAAGHADLEIGPFDAANVPERIDAVLKAIPALRGRVVRGGNPVAGATVRAQEAFDNKMVRRERYFHLLANPCENCPTTTTAEDGSFVLDTAKTGTWWLRAAEGRDATTLLGPFTLEGAPGPAEIEIDMTPRGGIAGRLRDADGAALAARRIDVSCGDGEVYTTITDDAGDFAFEGLAPGSWQVRYLELAQATSDPKQYSSVNRGAPPIPWDCRVVNGETTRYDIVVPEPTRVTLKLKCADASIVKAKWDIKAANAESFHSNRSIEAQFHPESDVYTLELVSSGSWRLDGHADVGDMSLYISHELEPPAGASEVVWTIPSGSVSGRIAPPAAGVRIRYAQETTEGLRAGAFVLTSEDGTFRFPFAFGGKVSLSTESPTRRWKEFTLTEGETRDVGEL